MFHNFRILFLFSALAALAGCSSMPTSPVSRPAPGTEGEVLVFRASSFIAGGVTLTVGADKDAFAHLSNGEQARVLLPAGTQEIFVRASSAEPTRLRVNVPKAGRVCLRASADLGTAAKVIVPIALMASGYHFYLDEVACPSAEELSKYKLVPVAYQ